MQKVNKFIFNYIKIYDLESQLKTQRGEDKRPYGVGLLVAGYDSSGPRLFRTCPSGNYYEHQSIAIGSRCQSSNTYLEIKFDEVKNADSMEALIKLAIGAMKKSQDHDITADNIDVSVVGEKQEFKVLSKTELSAYFVI